MTRASKNPAVIPSKNPTSARRIVARALVSTTMVAVIPWETLSVEKAAARI